MTGPATTRPHGYRWRVADEATDGLVWRLEAVRFPEPVTRWSSALFTTMETEVVARVMDETGVLLDGVASREFDGRIYTAIVPLGGGRRTARWLVPDRTTAGRLEFCVLGTDAREPQPALLRAAKRSLRRR